MSAARPKYRDLVDMLRHRIDDLPIGAALPSERVLAEDTGVSRMTARRAIATLEAEGLVSRQVGRGSFVARPVVSVPLQLTSFSDDMRARGLTPSSRVLEIRTLDAGEDLADAMRTQAGTPIVRIVRLRLADDEPIAIERTHLLADLVPGIADVDLANVSLYATLHDVYGVRVDAGEQTIRAGIVQPADAETLGVAPDAAVLELVRSTTTRDGGVVEHTVSTYPGDRFELSARIAPLRAQGSGPRSALRERD